MGKKEKDVKDCKPTARDILANLAANQLCLNKNDLNKALSAPFPEKAKLHLVAIYETEEGANTKDRSLAEGFVKRLQAKKSRYVVFTTLKNLENAKMLTYSFEIILHLVGHGNINKFSSQSISGGELAELVKNIILKFSITKIKLVSCYSGNRITIESDYFKFADDEILRIENADMLMSYAQKFSSALGLLFADPKLSRKTLPWVYGYCGAHVEKNVKKEGHHSYIEYSPDEFIRASKARVAFNGEQQVELPEEAEKLSQQKGTFGRQREGEEGGEEAELPITYTPYTQMVQFRLTQAKNSLIAEDEFSEDEARRLGNNS